MVATDNGTSLGTEPPADLSPDHQVWRVLDRAGRPARVDPARLAAANPTLETGAVVRYHGDLTEHHGVYWLILTDDPNDLVLRDDTGRFLRARPTSLDILA